MMKVLRRSRRLARAGGCAALALGLAGGAAAPAMAAPAAPALLTGIYGFGSNQFGELGDGGTTPSYTPALASGPPGTVRQVAAGLNAGAALMSDGTVWTWGSNYYGQLGNPGIGGSVSTPQRVPGLSGITQIAMSGEGSGYAVASDGSVWAWGDNSRGQLGSGTSGGSGFPPARVPGLTGVTQLSAGGYSVLALRSDGTVRAWGDNSGGELGDGTTTSHLTPEQVPGLTRITQVTTGLASFAVRSDGTLFSWGDNQSGALGNGSSGGHTVSPAAVRGVTSVTQVATDGDSTLAVAGIGRVAWAWGDNHCGQLGDGTTTSHPAPEQVPGLAGVTQVAIGAAWLLQSLSAAVRSDGTLLTWGCNGYGATGHGPSGSVLTPEAVAGLSQVGQVSFGGETGPNGSFGAFALTTGSAPGAVVPELEGDTTSKARLALQGAQLTLGTVSTAVDYTCADIGRVMSQRPAAGSVVSPGTAVSVTVGTAPPPSHPCQ